MATRISDFTHLAPFDAQAPAAARRRAEFTRAVVEAATSRLADGPWHSAVPCIGRVRRKLCNGRVEVERRDDTIGWLCSVCGDSGEVSQFAGSGSDLTPYTPSGRTVVWGFDEEERKVLIEATAQRPELRATIARGRCEPQLKGVFLVDATVAELDEVYTLVEILTDCTRSRRRIELLDGLRASLCTSMDGF